MNKKCFTIILTILIALNVFSQNINQKQLVREEASLMAMYFLNLIPEGREKDYGFNHRSDFSKIKIEEPYETFYVLATDNELAFVPGNEWRVPISIDGQYVSLLTVSFSNGKAEVVDLGGNVLSRKIQEYEKLYPEERVHRALIRNTFLNRDFITNNFSALCDFKKDTEKLQVNKSSLQPVYEINESLPKRMSIAAFCSATIEKSNNVPELK